MSSKAWVTLVSVSGPFEGEIGAVTPDGDGLVTLDVEASQVIEVPNGSTVTGIRLLDGGDDFPFTDGWYFVRICAAPGGTATLVLESTAVAAAYRITAPGSTRTSLTIGSVPVGIGYEAVGSRWRLVDPGIPRPVGVATLWGGDGAIPTGWLAAGSTVSRTTYAVLFARLGANAGPGDGTTTFDVPTPSSVGFGTWIFYAGR